jgi:hypothetical protein
VFVTVCVVDCSQILLEMYFGVRPFSASLAGVSMFINVCLLNEESILTIDQPLDSSISPRVECDDFILLACFPRLVAGRFPCISGEAPPSAPFSIVASNHNQVLGATLACFSNVNVSMSVGG